jgi:hypothetical protein
MAIYRKKKAGDTWHRYTNCSSWPSYDYEESYTKPSSSELAMNAEEGRRAGPAGSKW